jgi:nucleotide-binding universal stress UspA family protein
VKHVPVLIPTGGSKLAEHGVAHGLALAKSLVAKVSVIFVVEPFSEMTGRFLEAVATYAELRKEQATSALDRAANAAKDAGVSCETIQVENGQPHQAIIAAAEDQGCDLIVMSSHGRSGFSKFLIGSVTNKVLADAKTRTCRPPDGSNKLAGRWR